MPHQCLHCGKVFETLTEDILFGGCPECHRKKFTLTKEPMTDEERNTLLNRREGEIREMIRRSQEREPVGKEMPPVAAQDDRITWVEMDPGDAPEVINVVEPGVYEINIEKLMDDYPIIINRDGSYIVYLPSLFRKRKRKGAM